MSEVPAEKPRSKRRPLPLTETLVLDIVDYLLEHEGYGYSTQISSYMVDYKPRRYTSREVVGILRNRPCFRHAQAKDRKGGIRWRLDVFPTRSSQRPKRWNPMEIRCLGLGKVFGSKRIRRPCRRTRHL